MSGTAFNAGQLAELQSIVSVATLTALSKVTPKLGDPKSVLKGLHNRSELLATHIEPALKEAISRLLCVVPVKRFSLTLEKRHDPEWYRGQIIESAECGQKCGADPKKMIIEVYENFLQYIVDRAEPTKAGTTFKLGVFRSTELLSGREIASLLPKKHVFSESALSAVVAELASRQRSGENGHLELDAYEFFTADREVRLFWYKSRGHWYADTWPRESEKTVIPGYFIVQM